MDHFYCPRGAGPDSPYKAPFNGEATWRDSGTCSYCGSISPDAFFAAIEAGEELTPTDKNYKVYVGHRRKFYFQHLSDDEMNRFIDLHNARKLKLAYPGYFYVRPFFCGPPPKE